MCLRVIHTLHQIPMILYHFKSICIRQERAALSDCKAAAEIIKKRLEDNGTKVKEMYVIEHKSEASSGAKSEEYHNNTDKAKMHYHILVKFEPSHGATLGEIAKYIGVRPEIIEKPKQGRYSYDDMLAYLTHIKYKNKIQYAPEDVVTLAGTNYMDYYNEYKKKWIKARDFVAKKDVKPLDRIFKEAIKKLESAELSCSELAGIAEYRKLFFNAKYHRKLKDTEKMLKNLAELDCIRLSNKIVDKEISVEEAKEREEYKLVFKYFKEHF